MHQNLKANDIHTPQQSFIVFVIGFYRMKNCYTKHQMNIDLRNPIQSKEKAQSEVKSKYKKAICP